MRLEAAELVCENRGFYLGERKNAAVRLPPILLLLFATLGCGSGTQTATPDQAAVKKAMVPSQIALGDPIVNGIGMILAPIPAGEFQMGSPDVDGNAFDDEKPQHLVKCPKPFYLSVFEVTQGQYVKVMEARPWRGKNYVREGRDYPAVYVSWNDAVEFCRKLSETEGVEYRLPTEAEWEYSCRAGTATTYSFGHDVSQLGEHAWYDKNALDIGEQYAHAVGQKLPNPWGLFDLNGNVFEWCEDVYDQYHREAGNGPSEQVTDQNVAGRSGEAEQFEERVMRGGSFGSNSYYCRVAARRYGNPPGQYSFIGFRVARTYPASP